jgi:predicted Fe-Mo cluster-binding NifX family protein
MKVAVSSTGKSTNGAVAAVFGRCSYFLIAEIADGKIKSFVAKENTSANQTGGAGIAAAQAAAEANVSAVIAGSIGPRVAEVLRQFKIGIYKGEGKIKEAVREFIEGKLEKI